MIYLLEDDDSIRDLVIYTHYHADGQGHGVRQGHRPGRRRR